ncbi:MAG: Hsp70 family protein [Pyrinomonadaceae bacterium]
MRGVINEPSAAGVEYAHHHLGASGATAREYVVVYDLGGGTFDASVISMAERRHEVVASEGIAQLGGDDFDNLLLELALERAGLNDLPQDARAELLQECREKKEELHPNTRKIVIDVGRAVKGAGEVIVSTADFYERSRPLVAQTIEAMDRAMERSPTGAELDWRSVAAVYMVGGSSDLPIVARTLRERYGRQVRKSPTARAPAIGLAIGGSADEGYTLRERFTRHFGVWREAAEGREITFDVIFGKDTPLPEGPGEKLTAARRYRAGHNVGHFRYLECGRVEHQGHPVGDMTFWDEIYFPLAPDLQHEQETLAVFPVERTPESEQIIEELYSCDRAGIIEVEILNRTANYRRGYSLRVGTQKSER